MDFTPKPDDIIIGPDGITTTNFYDEEGLTERTLPRSILLLAGTTSTFTPFESLWDSGATNSILSPAAARRLGYNVPNEPDGHGSMKVAKGASAKIYGWTKGLRVRPPQHLEPSDGSKPRISALPSMRCLVADISEDVIIGFDYILPLQGGFCREQGRGCFRLASTAATEAPTVCIPLLGKPSGATTHFELDNGFAGPAVTSYRCAANHLMAPQKKGKTGKRSSTRKDRAEALDLLQYARDNPHMVTAVE